MCFVPRPHTVGWSVGSADKTNLICTEIWGGMPREKTTLRYISVLPVNIGRLFWRRSPWGMSPLMSATVRRSLQRVYRLRV